MSETLRFLVILDDAHTLAPEQFDLVFRDLARREIRIARWIMMRQDGLKPEIALGNADACIRSAKNVGAGAVTETDEEGPPPLAQQFLPRPPVRHNQIGCNAGSIGRGFAELRFDEAGVELVDEPVDFER